MRRPGDTYFRHRFPNLIISEAIWLYYTFSLSTDDVALLLLQRGITLSGESVRRWAQKFGPDFARQLKRRRPRVGDTWHLDELVATINGVEHHVWRAVDQHGAILDILVQERKDTEAATAFFNLLLAEYVVPDRIVTDQLASYSAAKVQMMALDDVKHVFVKSEARLNNIVENSHQPTRRREVAMLGFKSREQAQTFLSSFDPIRQHFRPKKHQMRAGVLLQRFLP